MKRSSSIMFLLLFFAGFTLAQRYESTPQGVKTQIQEMEVEIQFFSPEIVRVYKYPINGESKKESISVIKTAEKVSLNTLRIGDNISFISTSMRVELNLRNGQIRFFNTDDQLLFTEKPYGAQFTAIEDVGKPTYNARQAYMLEKGEAIYGLGQIQNGKMNQREGKILLKQNNMKITIPFFQSVKGYGLFWDNYAATTYQDNPQELSFESMGKQVDYYFMNGGNADGVIAAMRDLTGQSPMIPLWGFGYMQSKERYKTQDETVGVVKKYRELNVPLDGIIQDWRYWGQDSNWNAQSFDQSTFPNPQQMVNDVHKMNAHLMIVTWPGFGPHTPQYAEFKSKNMLIDFETWPPNSGTRPYDVYNPEARNIFWDYLNKGVFSLNTDAWWLDSTEPDHINVKERDFDQPTYLGSYRSVVNAFPIMHVGGIYDNQRKTTSDKRVFILTRSAFAGQQRYAANSWSGDVVATWETLQHQVPAGLNFSLSGIPYWNADIGGFFLWRYRNALQDKSYHELYVRWLQFGAFTPMMRSHGTDAPREIYQFGKKGDWSYDAIEKNINLRYRFLPYIYSTAWKVTSEAGSFMRAMFMDFADDKKTHDLGDQYMFGSSVLVAPVLHPMYVSKNDGVAVENFAATKARKLYLPEGASWFDYWTGKTYDGGQEIEKEAPIDIIPLFVKAGSILPFGPKVQFATEKKWDQLEIRVYPGADAEFVLYEDENNNYNYEKGLYSTIRFSWNDAAKTLTIAPREGSFPGMLKSRSFNVVLVSESNGIGDEPTKKFKKVSYKGKAKTVKL